MKKLKIYLDNCCFNRPFDDQNQIIIEIETRAKLEIQKLINEDVYELVWSFILDYENNANTPDKAQSIFKWKDISSTSITLNDKILSSAKEIMKTGIKNKDALHLACAIYAEVDYFISVDKRVLKYKDERIKILNPIEFIER